MATFNSKAILIEELVRDLDENYARMYGGEQPECAMAIRAAGHMAMEIIANSDALYHNVEHSVLVTLVGQEMLRGKFLMEGNVSPRDWVHFIVSLLCHDIGYVRGICPGDEAGKAVINRNGDQIDLPVDMTDAYLTPYHVERGAMFVSWRFKDHPVIDPKILSHNISNTKFPVPDQDIAGEPDAYTALVRAADLVGQMADPAYVRKLPALFHEFKETGVNEALGYETPDDMRDSYPDFFWTMVSEHIAQGTEYLKATQAGRQWLANLYSHIFTEEHLI